MKRALVTGGSGQIGDAISRQLVEQSCKPEAIEALVPMKRAGTPQEVANLDGFLADEKADYLSGQVISLNGGMV